MHRISALIFLITAFSLISTSVLAQLPGSLGPFSFGDVKGLAKLIMGHDVDPNWLQFPNFIYFIVFPFVAIVTVIYGILTDIRIFRSQNVRTILSIVIAAMALPSGALLYTVYALYTAGAWVAVVAFGLVFIFGTILWGVGRGTALVSNIRAINDEIKTTNEKMKQLTADYENNTINQDQYLEKLAPLQARKRKLLSKVGTIEEVGPGE